MQKEGEENHPTLRLCEVERPSSGSCGFHLSRTAWDPYPWVSGVESGSPAEAAGLQTGDCVLEVNGEDVLGQRIGEVASRVRARGDRVMLLLWNAGSDFHASVTGLSGMGPTPLCLQRLSNCLQAILQLLECPVCLETVPPPAYQCCHGHILCGRCRARSDRCPVCRVSLGPRGRCLVADKINCLLMSALSLNKQQKDTFTKKTKSHSNQQPLLYLKSRIVKDIPNSIPIDDGNTESSEARNIQSNILLKSNTRAVISPSISEECSSNQSNKSGQESSNVTLESQHTDTNASSSSNRSDGQNIHEDVGDSVSNLSASPIIIHPKASSEENISMYNQQSSSSHITSSQEATSLLRSRSLSTGQIPFRNKSTNESLHQNSIEKPLPFNEPDELLFHCPYPTKSTSYCRTSCNGTRSLLQHLREAHQGPLIQFFLRPSPSAVKLRLPLSSSKSASSSLVLFTTPDDVVFFIEVAAGATLGHRLVWLWLLGDAVEAERYRLRLTLPEGDTHTGPVFPLTSSWTDVVTSNCCLSIEEKRYLRGNPEVQLEILDVAKAN